MSDTASIHTGGGNGTSGGDSAESVINFGADINTFPNAYPFASQRVFGDRVIPPTTLSPSAATPVDFDTSYARFVDAHMTTPKKGRYRIQFAVYFSSLARNSRTMLYIITTKGGVDQSFYASAIQRSLDQPGASATFPTFVERTLDFEKGIVFRCAIASLHEAKYFSSYFRASLLGSVSDLTGS